MIMTYLHSNSCFPGEPKFSTSTCSGREPLVISGTGSLTDRMPFLSFNQQLSKHWRKHKAWTPTSSLASSFLHPPLDS